MSKLYLISQDKNHDWDTYDSAVVVAESSEEARQTIPINPRYRRSSPSQWCNPEYVKAEYLGIAEPGLEGVICASFNAG